MRIARGAGLLETGQVVALGIGLFTAIGQNRSSKHQVSNRSGTVPRGVDQANKQRKWEQQRRGEQLVSGTTVGSKVYAARQFCVSRSSDPRENIPLPAACPGGCVVPHCGLSSRAYKKLGEGYMRHVVSAVVQNVPGVLSHISGMLASRAYNIDSLAVGETEDPNLSRMTFVVVGDDTVLEQVRKQLEKIVTVVRVIDISSEDFVERDLMLLKVKAPTQRRSEIRELTDVFRGRIVNIGPESVIIEIAGQEKKVEAFIDLMRPFGIIELVRTGRIAMVRGNVPQNTEQKTS